jgi:predicted ester cyclase
MAMDNTALVRRFVDQVWNQGNLAVCDEILSPKLKIHDPLLGDVEGLDSAKQHVRLFRTAFPDFTTTIDDIGAIGDKVYVRWTATGTHKGNLMGISPTNRRGVVHGISINRFDGGKIVETYYAWDVYKMLEQLGLVPPMQKLATGQAQPTARA